MNAKIRNTINNLQNFYCIYLTYKVVIPREKVAMTLYRVDLFFLCLIMSIYAKKKIKVISTKEQSKNRATLF